MTERPLFTTQTKRTLLMLATIAGSREPQYCRRLSAPPQLPGDAGGAALHEAARRVKVPDELSIVGAESASRVPSRAAVRPRNVCLSYLLARRSVQAVALGGLATLVVLIDSGDWSSEPCSGSNRDRV